MAQIYEHDPEAWARLRGLMAMLALPPVRCVDGKERRRAFEIEIAPGEWREINEVSIEPDRITFAYGQNGSRKEWRFHPKHEGVPKWREVSLRPSVHHMFDVGGA